MLAFAALPLALQACAMRPLYGPSGESSTVRAELAGITIPEPRTRIDQLIRNDLLSAFRPAGTSAPERYVLTLETTARQERTVESESSRVARRTVFLTTSFVLRDISSGKALTSGKTFAQVPYDRTGQSFADLQAETNAFERAAREVSLDIRTRIAAYFASR
jgi:LPS-assembly lipoprotein